jgi:hypothetical protein
MHERAQTNIQLCNQLAAASWSVDDLARLRRTYELAMVIFSGQYRANGKTQIAHHVGVASVVSAHCDRREVALAGLVHSAYYLGDWGEGRFTVTPTKRERLRAAVGDDVERLVFGYTELAWDVESVRKLDARAPSLSDFERVLVLMRLANEIDEFGDSAMAYLRDNSHHGLADASGVAVMVSLAEHAGFETVGGRLRDVTGASAHLAVPDVLVTQAVDSVFVPTRSSRRRLHIALQDSKVGHAIAARVPGARELASYVRQRLA